MLVDVSLLQRLAAVGPFPWRWRVLVALPASLREALKEGLLRWPEPDSVVVELLVEHVPSPSCRSGAPELLVGVAASATELREVVASCEDAHVSAVLVATFEITPEVRAFADRHPRLVVVDGVQREAPAVRLDIARGIECLVRDRLYGDLLATFELQVAILGFLSRCADPRAGEQGEQADSTPSDETDEVEHALLEVSLGAHVRQVLGFPHKALKVAGNGLGACQDRLRRYRRVIPPGLQLASALLAADGQATPEAGVQLDLFRARRSVWQTVVRALRADLDAFAVPGIGDPTVSFGQMERRCYESALAHEGDCATRAAVRLGVTKNTVLQNRPVSRARRPSRRRRS